MSNKIRSKALAGYGWVFAGTFGQNLLQFTSLLVLARILAPEDFGLVAAAMIIIGLLKIFSELGVGPAVIQKKDLSLTDISTANTLGFGFGVLAAVSIYAGSGLFERLIGIEGLAEVTRYLSLMMPIAGLTVVGEALIQRELNFRRLSLFLVISYFCAHILVAIPFALAGFGLWALVLATLTQTVVMLVLVQITNKRLRVFGFDMHSAKMILNYGFGQSLGRIANYFAGQGDNFVVGRFLGAQALGLYGRAYQLMIVPVNLIAGVMDKVLFPLMATIQDDNAKLSKAYILCASIIAMVTYPISAVMFVLAEQIIVTVLGPNWIEATVILQVFSIFLIFRMSYKLSDALSRAKGSVYRRAWRQLIYAILVIGGGIIGQRWGLVGVSAGVGFAIMVNYLLMLHLSHNLIGFKWRSMLKLHLKHIGMTVSTFAVCLYSMETLVSYGWHQAVILVVCSIVSGVSIVLTWAIFNRWLRDELGLLQPIMDKFRARKARQVPGPDVVIREME